MTQTILAKPYQSNGNLLTPGLWRALEPLRDRPEPRRALATSKYLSFLTYRDRSASQEVGLTSIVETALDELLGQDISVLDPAAVRRYLLRHLDMVDPMALIGKVAANRFGGSAQLSLELYQDPEVEDSYLTLYVRQEPYDADILDQIEDVSRLFDAELATLSGWLLITTDFGAPR